MFRIFDEQDGVAHGDHGEQHPQAEVVHEPEVTLDVAARGVTCGIG